MDDATAAVIAYYRERLDDLALLDGAVQVGWDLAVPIGGRRRGGYCEGFEDEADEVTARLTAAGGFPGLMHMDAQAEGVITFQWGEEPRDARSVRDEIHNGRLYGYSESAIAAHLARHYASRTIRRAFLVADREASAGRCATVPL
jgi:hypothetical protein